MVSKISIGSSLSGPHYARVSLEKRGVVQVVLIRIN
eukprot:UN05827